MIWPLTLLPRWSGHPKPSNARFDGRTILVTAANTGLGLEAAKKVAAAGAATVITTARDENKAQQAKIAIEAHLTSQALPSCTIIPMALEMSDPSSIQSFTIALKRHTSHLDHAILNAGVFPTTYQPLPTGYELATQVNAISTIHLSLLLLPLLKASPLTTHSTISQRPHLTYISSYAAFMENLSATPWLTSSTRPLTALSAPTNFPTGAMAGMAQYGRSKLMLEYAFRRVAFLPFISEVGTAKDTDAPLVLVTSVDPGPTATGIFRSYDGWLGSLFIGAAKLVLRLPEQGAEAFVSSLVLGEEGKGQMWMDDQVVGGKSLGNVEGADGKRLGERAWDEMREIVSGWDYGEGTVKRVLGANRAVLG